MSAILAERRGYYRPVRSFSPTNQVTARSISAVRDKESIYAIVRSFIRSVVMQAPAGRGSEVEATTMQMGYRPERQTCKLLVSLCHT